MNPFDTTPSKDDKVIASEQRQVKKETHVAQIKPHPGHRVYQFDLSTGLITEAVIEAVNATYGGGIRKKVMQLPNCLYCSALNAKNALRKFVPMYERLKNAGMITPSE